MKTMLPGDGGVGRLGLEGAPCCTIFRPASPLQQIYLEVFWVVLFSKENLKWFLFMCSIRAAGDGIMTWHMLHGLDISTCVERRYNIRSCLNSMLSELIHLWLLPSPKSICTQSQFTLEIDIDEFAASWRGGAMTLGGGIRWKNNDSENNRRPVRAAKLMKSRWRWDWT